MFKNYHSLYSTGLPDYFTLVVCPPSSPLSSFLRRFGLPYGPPEQWIDSQKASKPTPKPNLVDAAWEGSLATIRSLIASGVSPDCTDAGGRTALSCACLKGFDSIAHFLISNGASINVADKWGSTPLHEALSGSKAVSGNDRQLDLVSTLVRLGADVNATTAKGWTPLLYASSSGWTAAVDLLLRSGADPDAINAQGESALDLAIRSAGWAKTASSLIPLLLRRIDKNRAFLNAMVGHRTSTLEVLRDVDPDIRDTSGKTALMCAAERGYNDILRLLLAERANTDLVDKEGYTALHYAVANGWHRSALLLLRRKANVNARDGEGRTPLMFAAGTGTRHMVRLLLRFGADDQNAGLA